MERLLTRFTIKTSFLLIFLLSLVNTSFATTAVRPSDDDLVIGARAIVRGKVLSIESAYDDAAGKIFTYITIKVREVIKGEITDRKIVIKELGGRASGRAMMVYGNPQFARGERVLLYLDTWADGSLRTYQMFLGKFSIVEDPRSGSSIVTRDITNEHVVLLPNPDGSSAGRSTDRMELHSYLQIIRQRLAILHEQSRAFERKFYRGIPLLNEPPGFARISSIAEFSPEFAFLGNVRWFEPDSGQAVTYNVNTTPSSVSGFPPLSVPETDVAAAAGAWSSVPGCALRVISGGTQRDCYTITDTPGINVVSNNCDGRNSPSSSCAGILAWGGWSSGTLESKVIGGTTFSRITQGFISFNPWAVCWFSDHCDVREITTHEMGHALGLDHSSDSTATMFAIAHFDERCASLRADDSAGISFLYPNTTGGPGPLAVSTSSLPVGNVGSTYNQALLASGGTSPYTWSLVSGQGTLPAGLALSGSGIISGTPTQTGTSNFTVNVTDSASGTAQKALSIVITSGSAPLDSQFVSQTVPTTLQPNQSFNANIKFLNTGTQTWGGSSFWLVSQNPPQNATWGGNGVPLDGFSIPPGQQLDLTFTAFAPATPGTYNFQWQLYQNGGIGFFGQPSANLQIQVGNSVVITTSSPLPSGTAGTPYSQTLSASGGTSPYSWSLATGSLPAGLTLSTGGVINGTPTTAGSASFTVRAADSASGSTQKAFSLTIGSAPIPVTITTGSPLPNGIAGSSYSQTLAASGGTGPYTWTVVPGSGSLPAGVSLSSAGTISGTPTAVGTFTFTVRANDSSSGSGQKAFAITIGAAAAPVSVTTESVPGGKVGVSYSASFSASGGSGPYSWSVVAGLGSLPSGLTLSAAGVISGTPTATGVFPFTVKANDSLAGSAQKAFSLTITSIGPPPSIQGLTSLAAIRNSTFNYRVGVAGGHAPFSWSIVSGGLAPGVSLSGSSGVISGMPSATGSWNFMVQVVDSDGANDQKTFTINVSPATIMIGDTAVPDYESGSPASFQFSASGGVSPYTWGVLAGALPAGLSLDPQTGLMSGTPVSAGTSAATIFVTDALSTSSIKTLSITVIAGPLKMMTSLLESASRLSAYRQTLSAAGGSGAYQWSANPAQLPPGLSLDPTTGLISGVPTQNGRFQFSASVRDQSGATISRNLEITVADPGTLPHINSANYKAGSLSLVIKGENFDKKGSLLIDGVQVTAKLKSAKVTAQDLNLSVGSHEIRIVTSQGLVSNTFFVVVSN